MEIVMAILLGLIGLAVCFVGLEVFFITLPIWGFVVGFFSGASLIHAWMGGGFFQTTLGIVVGLALGVLFAILAYFFWYFGVVFLCGSVGAMLGNGLSKAIGLDANWWLWIVGLVVGVLFALAALFLAIPVYLVIINTAMAGAAAIIAAVLPRWMKSRRSAVAVAARPRMSSICPPTSRREPAASARVAVSSRATAAG